MRSDYRPVQPTAAKNPHVIYEEFSPAADLDQSIFCYWNLRTEKPLDSDYIYTVITDGCIDIFFNLNETGENYVMGFCRSYTQFSLGKSFNYFGIRFFPAVFPALFDVNAKALRDNYSELKLFSEPTASFISETFRSTSTNEEISDKLNSHFREIVAEKDFEIDPRFLKALIIILENKGSTSIEKDLSAGISSRQLRRLFEKYIGDTAKSFSKVVRFQYLLKNTADPTGITGDKSYFDAGYYDQSHFIKDFKKLYGTTPENSGKE